VKKGSQVEVERIAQKKVGKRNRLATFSTLEGGGRGRCRLVGLSTVEKRGGGGVGLGAVLA